MSTETTSYSPFLGFGALGIFPAACEAKATLIVREALVGKNSVKVTFFLPILHGGKKFALLAEVLRAALGDFVVDAQLASPSIDKPVRTSAVQCRFILNNGRRRGGSIAANCLLSTDQISRQRIGDYVLRTRHFRKFGRQPDTL